MPYTLRRYLLERGRAAALAAKLKVSPSLVSMWGTGARLVPVARCFEIERLTGVRVELLRPDISFKRGKK